MSVCSFKKEEMILYLAIDPVTCGVKSIPRLLFDDGGYVLALDVAVGVAEQLM